jgi:hypothetical protein
VVKGIGRRGVSHRVTQRGVVKRTRVKAEAEKPFVDDKRARLAVKSLAMETRKTAQGTAGAGAGTVGVAGMFSAKKMRKAATVAALGLTLMGAGQTAMADTVFVEGGNRSEITQAARELAAESGEKFVLVRGGEGALASVFSKAQAGELNVDHLIISTQGEGVDTAKLASLKAQYPAAFAQVKHVHVVGADVSSAPLGEDPRAIFPNAETVVGFGLATTTESSPASAWLLKDTTQIADEIPAQASPQDALLEAIKIANAAKARGVSAHVDVAGQTQTHFAAAAADATAVDVPIALTGGVGEGQANADADVEAVQQRLKDLGFNIGVDGDAGPQTKRTIGVYASMVLGIEDAESATRSIAPDDLVHQWLQRADSPRWVEMPESGPGFKNADWDKHDFGSSTLADVIRNTGQRYHDGYLAEHPEASVIETNDASKIRGGDNKDHETHEAGLDLDVRLPRTDGASGTKVTWASYDRDAARAMIDAFLEDPQVERILIGDKVLLEEYAESSDANALKVVDGGKLHRDHIHVDICPTAPLSEPDVM